MLGKNLNSAKAVAGPEGIVRRTLVHNEQVMLCHFELKKGARIPLHDHKPHQIGYVVSGRVRFTSGRNPQGFEASAGDSYVFDSSEQHGAEVLEDSVFIEIFSPARPEYA
jgi:quercetin dioxygenase-like cupin family protein